MNTGENFPRGVEIVVSALIRNLAGEILVVRQPQWGNVWTLPGGHVKAGETLADGARREGEEETGLKLGEGRLVDSGEMIDSSTFSHPVHFIYFDYAFLAEDTRLEVDASEICEVRWLLPQDALNLELPPGYRHTITKHIELQQSQH